MTVHISTIGTIATEPKFVVKPEGAAFCAFRIAVSERRFDREQRCWQDGPTSWFSVTSFRMLAEHAHASFNKGDRVFVSGKLRTRNWEREGKTGTSVDIEADALGHDLRWGTSRFEKRPAAEAALTPETSRGWPAHSPDTSEIEDSITLSNQHSTRSPSSDEARSA